MREGMREYGAVETSVEVSADELQEYDSGPDCCVMCWRELGPLDGILKCKICEEAYERKFDHDRPRER